MDWLIAAPFSESSSDKWLAAFVPSGERRFSSIVAGYRHDRSRSASSLRQWLDYFGHGARAWRAARSAPRRTGLITCFPQIPLAVGLYNMALARPVPTIAWTFNVGNLAGGMKRQVAMKAFRHIDLFVVHSRAEIDVCSQWLELPKARFQFVPLQRGLRQRRLAEDTERPFLVSMGSAQRDYRLLFSVLGELGYPAVVVCAPHAVAGLKVPSNVDVRSGLTIEQCHELLQRARMNVVPVSNRTTASGQISLLDGMMFGCPTVITSCPGSVDYATHEHEALLVELGDHVQLKSAIERLWCDAQLRLGIAARARQRVEDEFSDQAVGRVMGKLLQQVERDRT